MQHRGHIIRFCGWGILVKWKVVSPEFQMEDRRFQDLWTKRGWNLLETQSNGFLNFWEMCRKIILSASVPCLMAQDDKLTHNTNCGKLNNILARRFRNLSNLLNIPTLTNPWKHRKNSNSRNNQQDTQIKTKIDTELH